MSGGYSDIYSDIYSGAGSPLPAPTGVANLPSKVAGEIVTADDLNAVGNTASFLLNKPMARSHDAAGGQTIPTTGSGVICNFASKNFDTDGMWAAANPGRLTVQTAGWYKARYSIEIAPGSGTFNSDMFVTTGPNNPQGNGLALANVLAGYCVQANTLVGYAGASGLVPFYLYVGDYVQVRILAAGAGSTTGAAAGFPFGFLSLEFVSA